MAEVDNKTCTQLEVHDETEATRLLFVKSEWKPTRVDPTSFNLAASDGLRAWRFDGSEAFVSARAEAWDKQARWVMAKLQFYLSVGQPGVTYRFTTTRDNHRKLSFDIEDQESELSLTANLLLVTASDPEIVTCDLLTFLYDSNCRLTESYLKKCRSLDMSLRENDALVDENTRLKNGKIEYEKDAFTKFVAVLNTKKAKSRELKKEIENLKKENGKRRDESKSKFSEDERDHTTSSSSEDEEESITPEKKLKREEAFTERLVNVEKPFTEPGSTSGMNVVHGDPDATQPLLDETEVDAPAAPKQEPASLPALPGDEPYKGIQRKRRRQL